MLENKENSDQDVEKQGDKYWTSSKKAPESLSFSSADFKYPITVHADDIDLYSMVYFHRGGRLQRAPDMPKGWLPTDLDKATRWRLRTIPADADVTVVGALVHTGAAYELRSFDWHGHQQKVIIKRNK